VQHERLPGLAHLQAGWNMSQPLAGVCVLDFSTLLPGPLATLLLAEAGGRNHQDRAPRRFAPQLAAAGRAISALPGPLGSAFRGKAAILGYPALGENNELMEQRGAA